jgi:hypothetical protein
VISQGIHPSNVVITKLKIDPDRQAILDRSGPIQGQCGQGQVHGQGHQLISQMKSFVLCLHGFFRHRLLIKHYNSFL